MDFVNDLSGRHLLRLSTTVDAPDYVKSASVIAEDIDPLPNGAFAVPHKREFPVDTAGHVWLSYGYCKSAGINDTTILGKLKQAASLFEITKDIEAIDAAFDQMAKSASQAPNKQFAINIDFGDPDPGSDVPMRKSGGVHGFYPISTQFDIEASAVKLANDQQKIPLEVFVEGCRNLVKAATDLKVDMNFLPKRITDYGVERIADPATLMHFAEMRKAATNDPIYGEIAEAAVQNNDGLGSYEYAELWLKADHLNGYKKAKHEPDAFLLFNSGPTVEAMERQIESWVDIGGAPVPVTKVASVREETVRKCFAKETAEKLIKLVKQAASSTGSELTAAFLDLDDGVKKAFVKRVILA